ncbi:MAG: phosphotransferase, partial [Pseudomonadota bacterium]
EPTLEDAAPLPGTPQLTEHSALLTFAQVARVLPGRRVSGHARVDDGTPYFAKLFYGADARRYWQRELRGAERMVTAGVPCARVQATGATADGGGYVVLYEWLQDAVNLREFNQQEIFAAVEILARLHSANSVQTDVHFNNFVRCGDTVYAVDADGVRAAQLLRQHFNNLAMLLAQRAPWYDTDIADIWRHYAAARGEYVSKMGSADQLVQLTQLQRAHRVRRYLQKTQRECTEFVHKRSWQRNWLCDRGHWPALQRFMLFPELFMGEGTPLKLGNSATVVRVEIDGSPYIVKRYNIKNWSHRIRRWFKRRARLAWRNGHWLAFLGVPTAKPVALLELKWGWFTQVCYLLMPDCGERNLGQLVATDEAAFAELAPQAIDILCRLQAAQLSHGDLKATNFVIHDGNLSLIDYDAVQAGSIHPDVQRFLANWRAQPELQQAWRARLTAAGLLPE